MSNCYFCHRPLSADVACGDIEIVIPSGDFEKETDEFGFEHLIPDTYSEHAHARCLSEARAQYELRTRTARGAA